MDARRLFDTIKKAGGAVTTDEYYGILEAAAWCAYWQQQRSSGGAGPQDATGSGNQPTWSSELWEGVDSILGEMEGQGLELGCWCVTMCSRIARLVQSNVMVMHVCTMLLLRREISKDRFLTRLSSSVTSTHCFFKFDTWVSC
jgi:hypothetical protein